MRSLACMALLVLSACALPGRTTFAPAPAAPAPADIVAVRAFEGRIALVSIKPGTADFAAPLKGAVAQALAIKPEAAFQVVAQCKAAAPDVATACLTGLMPRAQAVVQDVIADGVTADRVSLLARSGGADDLILVYVK